MLDVRLLGNRNGRISLGRYANQLDLRQVRKCGERLGDIYNDLAEHFFNSIDHPIDVFPLRHNVRYWPIADIPSCTAHVRFRGADMTFCGANVCF
jgi:hypothetical protein